MSTTACGGCGRAIDGGKAACRAEYEALLVRDYSDPLFFGVHNLFVDCFCLQHPDENCVSAKSLAVHLLRLALVTDEIAGAAATSADLRRWLEGSPKLDKPDLPARRGAITLGDLAGIDDPEVWRAAVGRWAVSIWTAYRDLHPRARIWAAEAGRAAPRR